MNYHKEGDLLESALMEELLRRWPNSKIIETKTDSVHGIDFAVELGGLGVGIVESKSGSGSVRQPQMSKEWIRSRINGELYRALVRAVRANRPIFYATYRTSKIFDPKNRQEVIGYKVRSASPTGSLTWHDLFPDEPEPEKENWQQAGQDAIDLGRDLLVTHILKDRNRKQVNEYRLPIGQISKAVYDSTITYKTFPFAIPHSHKIIENGDVVYDRPITEWDAHLAQKGGLDTASAQTKQCSGCRHMFYDTSAQEHCFTCYTKAQANGKAEAERLCRAADNMKNATDHKETAERIKQLQAQWRELGPLPADDREKLWQRFSAATQVFFDARTKHFEQQDKVRQNNKQKAKSLISKAQLIARSTDWKDAGQKIKGLQQEWKGIQPLPKDDADNLWQQFQSATQSFYDARTKHFDQQDKIRQNNKQKAKSLIAKAQSIARSTDWKDAGQKIKGLQQEWKGIQPLPKDDADNLWQQFQSATQSFYDARSKHFDQQDKIRQTNKQKAKSLISKAQSVARSTDWKDAGQKIKGLQQEWKGVQPLPKDDADNLWQQFQSATQSFYDARSKHFDQQDRIRQNNKQKAKSLITKAQSIARSTDWKDAGQKIKGLQQEWKGVQPLPKDEADNLWQQFQNATQSFYDARSKHFDQQDRERQDNRRRAQRLIEQANSAASTNDFKAGAQRIKDLQAEWKGVHPLPKEDSDRLWSDFKDATQRFYDRRSDFYDEQNRQWQERTRASIERAEAALRRTMDSINHDEDKIDRWNGTIRNLNPGGSADEIRRSLEGKIRSVEDKIYSKKEKLRDIESSIADMRDKLNRR